MRYFLFALCILMLGCENADEQFDAPAQPVDKPSDTADVSTGYSYAIIQNDTAGYGYQILEDGKMIINQPTIPAIQGNHAFVSQEEVKMMAEFVKLKIEKGIMPPTVSVAEMDSMGITLPKQEE